MKETPLAEFLAGREARRKQSGVIFTPEYVETLRNKGLGRTPEKRALLAVIEARAAAAKTKTKVKA
ncbi:MAG: hypothetical protein INF97_15345 [Roseomonas sp.]|nr:hypothetical protein [Roseomonas sp.]